MKITIENIANAILSHDNFIVTAHHNPDGDALGAMCAVGYILKQCNKNFILYNISGVPFYLQDIPLPSRMYTQLADIPKEFIPESLIVLDISDPKRMGDELYSLLPSLYSINIDHHHSCPAFGTVNYIDSSYAATGCIIGCIAEYLNIGLEGDLGECLYLSITEDTGNFRNTNTDTLSFTLASTIVKNGLNVGEFVHKYQNQWSLEKMKLWGFLLSSFTPYYDGQLLIMQVSETLLNTYGCLPEDIDGVNSFLMRIHNVRMVITLREISETDKQGVKASIRSYGIDCIPLVQRFNGGGHKNAAGVFFPNLDLNTVELMLYKAIEELQYIV